MTSLIASEEPLSNVVPTEIWFSDGNIVLVASRSAFKVHRGQLERHSEVFKDLFAIPQPIDEETFDGCSWVRLYDSPSDVLYLLRALYDGLYFESNPSSKDFSAIAAVLRLSSKYLIDHLRQRCLKRLDLDWPSSLSGWDLREQLAAEASGRYNPRECYPHPILLVKLARELSLPQYLPAAFYDLSRYGPRRIVSGTTLPVPLISEKGSPNPPLTDTPYNTPTLSQPAEQNQSPQNSDGAGIGTTPMTGEPLFFGNEDLFTVFIGRESGQRYITGFIEEELVCRKVSKDCRNKHLDNSRVCRESMYYIMLNVLRAVSGISHGRDADPLYTLAQAEHMLTRTDFSDGVTTQCALKMCVVCKGAFTECVDKARREVWDVMPSWFGLDIEESRDRETDNFELEIQVAVGDSA
ncbi:hypothetical protein ABKN59_009447 [Abortiporus biennis]